PALPSSSECSQRMLDGRPRPYVADTFFPAPAPPQSPVLAAALYLTLHDESPHAAYTPCPRVLMTPGCLFPYHSSHTVSHHDYLYF
ncbi:hypothetical protein B0H10DRAFT_2038911, partial [Mycena sp. CBHHK59/15]